MREMGVLNSPHACMYSKPWVEPEQDLLPVVVDRQRDAVDVERVSCPVIPGPPRSRMWVVEEGGYRRDCLEGVGLDEDHGATPRD